MPLSMRQKRRRKGDIRFAFQCPVFSVRHMRTHARYEAADQAAGSGGSVDEGGSAYGAAASSRSVSTESGEPPPSAADDEEPALASAEVKPPSPMDTATVS